MSAEPETIPADAVGHIVRTEGLVSGRPRISGTRIRVLDIAAQHLTHRRSVAEIVEQFPGISSGDVHAALTYYYDHREEVDAADAEDAELIRQLQSRQPDQVHDRRA